MHVEPHHSVDELQTFARDQDDATLRSRVQAIVLARQGMTAPQVAKAVGYSRRRVQGWVHQYNVGGLAALADKPRKGRACKLSEAQRQALAARLDAGPRPEDGVCTLRGEDVRRIVEKEFNVMYKLSAIYPLLHRLGYSCLMPREQHPQADPQAQEAFKKTPLTR
jgi:transposase